METLLLSFIRRFTTTSSNENKTIEDPEANIEAVENSDAVPSLNDPTLNPHDNPIRVVDNPLNIPFPEVQTFDDILPLSSTPLSSIHRQSARLSSVRPRGLLPLEIEESPVPHLSGSRIQAALSRRSDQVRKLLSKSKSDSSSS